MAQMSKQQRIEYLYRVIASIDDPEDCRVLFEDLCTVKEVENMADRCYAARLLMQGDTYAQVIEKTEISSATLSRVSRCVQYGKGYSKLIKKE